MTRQTARNFGQFAETLCSFVLRLKGYKILARNLQTGVGELDIVARRGNVVAFVEVKARSSFDLALDSVSFHQRRRIENASLVFLSRDPRLQECDSRFDIALVMPWKIPRFILNAWQAGE